jgi:uncharacterized membrane protein YkvA (DUF1232 family)
MWMFRLRRFLRVAGREALMLLFALRDPDTPRSVKLGILLLGVYVVSPIDLVPDVLLLFGWADDLAVLMLGVPFLVRRLPAAVQARAAFRVEQLLARFRTGNA